MEQLRITTKKRIWIISLLVLILVMTIGGVMIFGRQEGYRTIKIFEISGRVGVVHDGVEYEAYPGMVLSEGYTIVTSSNSYVRLALDGDKYIKLEEGSKASFDTLGKLGTGKTTINLERGVILSEIVHSLKANENFIVNTPNAVLAVRGTLFKVEVNVNEKGESNTNVYTYGGAVGSKRIEPNGNVIEEQVIIDAGYKTTVKMDDVETIYVVEEVENVEAPENTEPINVIDIPDEDMVDIYFATKNGHDMFIPMEDIEQELEYRGIDIEEEVSVYNKAESLEDTKLVTSIDDGHIIVMDNGQSGNQDNGQGGNQGNDQGNGQGGNQDNNQGNGQGGNQDNNQGNGGNNSNQGIVGDGEHRHIETETIFEPTCVDEGRKIVKCSDCGETISQRALAPLGHQEAEPNVIKRATCLEEGLQEINCALCNVLISEEVIPVTEHQEMAVGTKDVHTKCMDCDTIMSTSHKYASSVTKEATCKAEGELTYSCDCGHSYTEAIAKGEHKEKIITVAATCTKEGKVTTSCEFCNTVYKEEKIAATGHLHEVNSGKANAHTECADCGTVISKTHTYSTTVVKQATCKEDGSSKSTCSCGYSYTTAIPGGAHTKVNPNASQSTCAGCSVKLIDFTSSNFPDDKFLSKLKEDGIDWNSDGMLDESEINAVTDIRYHYATISDFTGLEHFTELTNLELIGNAASVIPFENLTKLELLNLGYTSITSADVSKLTNLENLQLMGTSISSIDLSKNVKLAHLSLASCTNLTSIDLTNNTKIENIQLQGTNIRELQINGYSDLREVWLSDATMEKVIITNCPNFTTLVLPGSVSTVDISGCPLLYDLDLSEVKESIYTFRANDTRLRGLIDLSGCTYLQEVSMNNCIGITGIDVSDCYSLSTLSVTNGSALFVDADNCLALWTAEVLENVYDVGYGTETVDFSELMGFESSKVTVVSGGTFSNGVFYFDAGSNMIVYNYLLSNDVYGQFIIKYN